MITFVYVAEKQDLAFENHLVASAGLGASEVLYYREDSFAKVYNKALKEAKSEIIVFARNDIEIHSLNWGKKIVDHFARTNYGILGIVGSTIVPMSGLVWEKEEPLVGRIWYHTFEPRSENKFSEVFKGQVIPVITLDDAFFVVDRRKLKASFNEAFVKDSFYDIDFCVENYKQGVEIGIVFDIKVLKLSFNENDDAWVENRKLFVSKHTDLPLRMKPEVLLSKTSIKLTRMPKVSIIIASRNKPVELASCLESIYEKTTYPNLEIFVVDIGSKASDVKAVKEFIRKRRNTKFLSISNEHMPTLYESVVAEHVSKDSELLLFCDAEVILLNDAISRMVKAYLDAGDDCGTLGVRMHMKNNMVRHAGLMLFSTQTEEGFELGLGYQGYQSAYKYKNAVIKNTLGSCKDFLMIPKKLFLELGGFDGQYLHSLEDFEFNMRTILAGKKNILVGTAVCYYLGIGIPKFLPEDYLSLVNFINENIDAITPYVDLLHVA
ncbi:MAG: glycosyltransferase [Verrucomicrobia bacterium]|nr:glycosyltransferase [Verrucomicrobiota bacterium]